MIFKAILHELPDHTDRRRSKRRALVLSVPVSSLSAGEFSATVLDISTGGLLIQTGAKMLSVGDDLLVELPDRGPTKSNVVWRSGHYFGCKFEYEISETTISAIIQKAENEAQVALSAGPDEKDQVRAAQAKIEELSRREFEVMRGLLAGLKNKSIAHELGLSVRTVEIYRARLTRKLGMGGLSVAVRTAVLAGVQPLVARENKRAEGSGGLPERQPPENS